MPIKPSNQNQNSLQFNQEVINFPKQYGLKMLFNTYYCFLLQGVSCDLFNGFWYVTVLNIGPIHDNSLSCAKILEFRPQLFELKHLKALSLFKCFESQHKHHQATIPNAHWEKLAGSLESLEYRSNRGLIGKIPSTPC